MNVIDFIASNVKKVLMKEGYPSSACQQGADCAVDHYKRCSQASKKGGIFDDCLSVARAYVKRHGKLKKGVR